MLGKVFTPHRNAGVPGRLGKVPFWGMVTTLLTDRREVGEGRQENHHHEPGQLSAPEQGVARGDQDDVEQGPGRDEDGHGARKEYRRGLPMRVLSHPATLRAARISSRRSRGQGQQTYQVLGCALNGGL